MADRWWSRREEPSAPTPWPDDAYEALASRAGRACFGLLFSEERWVHRRVETISMLSHEFVRRSVSVDFTIPEPLTPLLSLPASQGQHVAPIATLRKVRLRNFDLSDESGRAVPLVSRAQNENIAHQALLTAATRALDEQGMGPASDSLEADLRRIAAGNPAEAEVALAEWVDAIEAGDPQYEQVAADPRAATLMLDLAQNYVLLAVLDDPSRRRLIKFSYDDDIGSGPARLTLAENLGWSPVLVETPVAAALATKSYHAEVEIPDELRIVGSVIADRRQSVWLAVDGDADRAALYAPEVPPDADPVLVFGLRAERLGFPAVAFGVSAITAAVLLFGAAWGDLATEQAGPPITLLLAASALFSGAVATRGQHPLVQRIFAWPRRALYLSALMALVAAAPLAFGLCESVVRTTWWTAAVIAVIFAAILGVTFGCSAPTTRREPT